MSEDAQVSGGGRGPASPDGELAPLFGDQDPSWQTGAGAGPAWSLSPAPPPQQQRGRMGIGLLVGLVVGLLLFGTAGFVLGRSTATVRSAPPAPTSSVETASPSESVPPPPPPYEQAQVAANKSKLVPALQGLAAPWLPHIGGCSRNGQNTKGEKARVRCQHGDVSIVFVEFNSTADREKARLANLARQVDARKLAPGVAERREGPTPSGRTTGTYIEYAYSAKVDKKSPIVAALWWDDKDAPVGAYLVAYWRDDLGGSWEPLRDLWSRRA